MEADLANGINLVDVRKESEYLSEHAIEAGNEPLDTIFDNLNAFDKNETYYIHCAGGYRSMIAASILKANGVDNVIDVQGGFKAIKDETDLTLTDYVCPTTLL